MTQLFPGSAYAPVGNRVKGGIGNLLDKTLDFTRQKPLAVLGAKNDTKLPGGSMIEHRSITTTVFWVGEPADSSNGFIANSSSAWDENWQAHYGGVDAPAPRNKYFPAAFKPKENPFYFALPYSDLTDSGDRKDTAKFCPNSTNKSLTDYSWCKNSWIAISCGNSIAYAQWEDVGPYEEDDVSYVFGSAPPKNQKGEKAGLDVSPAVQTYLGLRDVDHCGWSFVGYGDVPSGPWKDIITNSRGTTVSI